MELPSQFPTTPLEERRPDEPKSMQLNTPRASMKQRASTRTVLAISYRSMAMHCNNLRDKGGNDSELHGGSIIEGGECGCGIGDDA